MRSPIPLFALLLLTSCASVPPVDIDSFAARAGVARSAISEASGCAFAQVLPGDTRAKFTNAQCALLSDRMIVLSADVRKSAGGLPRTVRFSEVDRVALTTFGRAKQLQFRLGDRLIVIELADGASAEAPATRSLYGSVVSAGAKPFEGSYILGLPDTIYIPVPVGK